ncbi:P2Y purinoceptor 3-like [Thunnus albacares]|uniref:P2Y purinoceptor 3-like n=1 Tax=Thunnus albacares TaxID=8236 RepID=UPI001CF66A41|nr:P2Y purinoceptor 3-like [Thunnus albacares]
MGNQSTTSVISSNNASNISISGNDTLGGGQAPFGIHTFWSFVFSMASVTEVMSHCHLQSGRMGWFGIKIFLLVSALPANAGLMWMLMSGKGAMTASEVLGVNVSVMDILYCLGLPLDIYTTVHKSSETTHSVNEALFALNIFGCPLLLTFMCLERHMAAARPVAYMKLGRREYRVIMCACAWILTVAVALIGYFVGVLTIALYLSVIISVLFLVMLLCLLGIVRVLCQSGPGEGSGANVPLKRQALKNIVAVMVPSVVAYSPLIALVPFMALNVSKHTENISPEQCNILQFLLAFPNFGLYIGPMFYLSRFRQVSCWRKERQTPNSKTQAE